MFPASDRHWDEVRAFLARRMGAGEGLLAPHPFVEVFPQCQPYRTLHAVAPERLDWVVLHKGMLPELGRAALDHFLAERVPVLANEVFVVLARRADPRDRVAFVHVETLRRRLPAPEPAPPERSAVLVTTYERPDALARSLPQIVALGAPVLVVDDGSGAVARERNAKLCAASGARYLGLGENRGLPTALNAGLVWWLADPGIAWISVFQDDVDVRRDCLARLARVQDAKARPILSGRACPRHASHGSETIAGLETLRFRSLPGIHVHAHRDYWRDVLPIPTPYLGAPKSGRGQGSDEDFWVTCWSPRSIAKRGGFVVCVPGLVRTFGHTGELSTWDRGRQHAPDPPLAPEP